MSALDVMHPPASAGISDGPPPAPRARFGSVVRHLRHPLLVAGLACLVPSLLVAAIGPFFSADPFSHDLRSILQPPGPLHLAGTDQFGRDVLARILHGARYSLAVSTASLLLGGGCGVILGLMSGFYRGRLGAFLQAALDFLMAFPAIMMAILAAALLGNNLGSVAGAIGIALLPRFALVIRSRVLALTQAGYVEAARSTGATTSRVLFRHILPNTMAPVIVLTTLYFPLVISLEASLGYLGLGVPPDVPTWGRIIADGQPYFQVAPWVSIVPGVVILLVSLSFNLIGDGLRDILDPKLRDR